MKKFKIVTLAILTSLGINTWAQTEANLAGRVVDRYGNPLNGVKLSIEGYSHELKTTTDRNGNFTFNATGNILIVETMKGDVKRVKIDGNNTGDIVIDFASEAVSYGFGLEQTNANSTGSVATVHADHIDNRGAFNVGNALYGNVAGLTTMQNTGNVWDQISSMSVRGSKTLNGNNGVLLLIDGLERDNNYQALNYISPEEVESVSILRDAAAVALYGYRGVNGVINIVTKRGKENTREISAQYTHGFNYMNDLPDMVDGYTYARAINEALTNDGASPRYSSQELDAFKSGKYPSLYPSVDWQDEVLRNMGNSSIATLNFRGGANNVRYYTMLSLQDDQGFIKEVHNDAYSNQEQYSRLNFRTNLDIDLTPKTLLKANLSGILNEYSRPGWESDNLISKLYTTPSAAFPIKTDNGLWGGNSTWDVNQNPAYIAQGHGYTKGHTRVLIADVSLKQDLSVITEGLSASARIGYDNMARYWEAFITNSKYGMQSVTAWENGVPTEFSDFEGGSDGTDNSSGFSWEYRSTNTQLNLDWKRMFGKHDLYSMLLYTHKLDDRNATNVKLYTQSASWYTHYGYDNRLFADFTLSMSASNRIEKANRWKPAPTLGLSWVISNEDFMSSQNIIDFMKLRASAGILYTDNIPTNGYWNTTVVGGSSYPVVGGDNFANGSGGWQEGRLPSLNGRLEKSNKYNIGLDVSMLKGLTFNVDAFYERRSDIWVSASGQNSAVLGVDDPYVNAGIVDSYGYEVAANYNRAFGDFKVSLGGNFSFNRNEVVENLETPVAYDYLSGKGKSVDQIWGLQAVGFFIDDADIASSPAQQFGPVQAGDVKYKDVNNDGVVNNDDRVAMGYSSAWPEIYYGFNLGFEWKGIGANAFFQGVGNYTAWLSSGNSYQTSFVGDRTISNYAYENRWTPENPNALFPRLTNKTVDNNTQASSIWLADRSFLKLRNVEVYYKFPSMLINKVKLNNAKVFVRGVDLFSWDNMPITDPEAVGNVHPTTRSIQVGLSLGI